MRHRPGFRRSTPGTLRKSKVLKLRGAPKWVFTKIPPPGSWSNLGGSCMSRFHLQCTAAVLFASLSISTVCLAQGSRGSITGKVTDPQSAVVPSAIVTVLNVLTGVSNKIVTNQTGYNEANFLDPGTYSLTVEAPGFTGLVRSGIVVDTGDRLSVDLRLEIGASTQSIQVTGDAPLLETTNASGGRVLDTRDIAQLPYTTMNPFALQAIAPGMV